MKSDEIGKKIREKAFELGFEDCGIIRVSELKGYETKLDERIAACPTSKLMLEPLRKYAKLNETHEWGKSIIVCVTRYGKYKMPEGLEGYIGKYYIYDHKLQPDAQMNINITKFEKFIESLGIKVDKELNGITSGRFAAQKAGLGVIRKNNFLYTKSGSWVIIDTWLIDNEIELLSDTKLEGCPEGCNRCVEACPTKALSKPYCTNMETCITRLTWGIRDLLPRELRKSLKNWIYGCDECQNACPMNKNAWSSEQEYPGLESLSKEISLEKIFLTDENKLKQVLTSKFWFIRTESLWIWKVNVLRAMVYSYEPKYERYIMLGINDEDEKVREMALWASQEVGINNKK